MTRPTGRAQQQRERTQVAAKHRAVAAQFRRVRLDDLAESYERDAAQLEAETFAWPEGMTRQRAEQLIAKARPDLVLTDATDAWLAGALAALVNLGEVDLSEPKPAPPAPEQPTQAQLEDDKPDEERADGVSMWRSPHAGSLSSFDPVRDGVGEYASPPPGKRRKKKGAR